VSSVGQAVGGLVGGVIGFFLGGPTGALYGAQLGMMGGGLLDPAKVKGPRLEDLSFQTSTYGSVIPRVYGTIAQTGNVFWLKNNKLTERSSTSGGKGGPEVTTYKYYATFAVGLCQGPIDGVRRIWIGPDLWYDAGSATVKKIIASQKKSDKFTVYLGTETQTADPLIQADKGAANTPAYRGLAYIVFHDLPLEKYGNSLAGAQVKVEIVESATFGIPRFIDYVDIAGYPLGYYPHPSYSGEDGVMMFYGYDPYAGTTVVDGVTVGVNEALLMVDHDGNFIGVDGVPTDMLRPQFVSTGSITTAIGQLGSAQIGWGGTGADTVWWPEYASSWAIQNGTRAILPWGDLGGKDTTAVTGLKGDIADALTGEAGRYVIGIAFNSARDRMLITTGGVGRATNITANRYFLLDDDLNILVSGTIAVTTSNIWNIGNNTNESPNGGTLIEDDGYSGWTSYGGTGAIGTRYFYIDSSNVMQIGSESSHTFAGAGNLSCSLEDGIFYVFVRTATMGRVYRYTAFPTLTGADSGLGDIVEAECLASNLLSVGDLDVTQLTDPVHGYRVGALGAIRTSIEPLRMGWPFDVVQHGYGIQFKARGSASVATITADELDARAASAEPGVRIADTREMDLQLPQKVTVKYLDVVREYDINEQSDERLNTDAVNEIAIELPIVMNADEGKQTASMLLYLYWMERYDISFSLPPTYAHLEPADVVTIEADNATYEVRLISIQYMADGRLECKAKYNRAAIYTQTGNGEEGQSTGDELTLAGPTAYQLLDIPLMRDDDDTAGFPVAMGGYLGAWPGGILYRSDDDGQTWVDTVASVSPGAVIGYAVGTLSSHGGTVIDFSSTLTVRVYSGELASVTEAQMFAGQNWFAYGVDGRWEIIAAMTSTLQSDGSYILRDFMRGQKGTEWATGVHAANDKIVLLSAAAMNFVSLNSSAIGTSKLYRAITFGYDLDSNSELSFSYNGVNLECLSPVHLSGNRDPGTNDWTITWVRRSRFGAWRDYIDAPLGEASESYVVEIYSSGTYATLKRTLTATSETAPYTSAQQVTDFGSNQSTLYLKIYQVSATVGRGYALTSSITR
jgi:hypothetical protein